jgi:hypothetical protein
MIFESFGKRPELTKQHPPNMALSIARIPYLAGK